MRFVFKTLMFLSVIFLAGCGQQGPLYFPDETEQSRMGVEPDTEEQ